MGAHRALWSGPQAIVVGPTGRRGGHIEENFRKCRNINVMVKGTHVLLQVAWARHIWHRNQWDASSMPGCCIADRRVSPLQSGIVYMEPH